jgi:hypothetical protein
MGMMYMKYRTSHTESRTRRNARPHPVFGLSGPRYEVLSDALGSRS